MGPSFKKGISPVCAVARLGMHGHVWACRIGGRAARIIRSQEDAWGEKSHRASCRLVLVVRDGTDAFLPKTAYQNEEASLYSAAAEQEGSAGVAWARTGGSTRLGSRLHA